METRFFYDIQLKKLYNCEQNSHAIYHLNKKLDKNFDDYIRGIIYNNTCYIRIYYPYDDIIDISMTELLLRSHKLITKELRHIQKALLKEYNFNGTIKLNVTNDILKEKLKTNFV